jgi:periplasmic divalent cation tolerance protein
VTPSPELPDCVQVTTTASSAEGAQAIATDLVTNQLAACVQVFPIRSTYRWQGSVEEQDEWMCVAKTTAAASTTIVEHIGGRHSYELPEITVVPIIGGSDPYLRWIAEEVRQPDTGS